MGAIKVSVVACGNSCSLEGWEWELEWRRAGFIILPQALKLVIPGIANTLLALVKDTPLIFVVGLMELAGMIGLAKTNPKWLGMAMEGYVFAGLVFWIICYAMSRYSQNLEKKLSTER